eukprot:1321655-Rhodomonas_salina.1
MIQYCPSHCDHGGGYTASGSAQGHLEVPSELWTLAGVSTRPRLTRHAHLCRDWLLVCSLRVSDRADELLRFFSYSVATNGGGGAAPSSCSPMSCS